MNLKPLSLPCGKSEKYKNIHLSNYSTHMYFKNKNKNNIIGELKIIIDKLHTISENKIMLGESNSAIDNISKARRMINKM